MDLDLGFQHQLPIYVSTGTIRYKTNKQRAHHKQNNSERPSFQEMPRFFDDYSNTYLTHDSSAGRKQQRRGWKFRENFKSHYAKHMQGWRRGPMGLANAQQGYMRAHGGGMDALPPLPEGYKQDVDPVTGIVFYIHVTTRARTWVRPGFIPPPPGSGPPPPNYRPQQYPAAGQQQQPPFRGPPPSSAGGPPPPPGHLPPPPPNNLPPPPGAAANLPRPPAAGY